MENNIGLRKLREESDLLRKLVAIAPWFASVDARGLNPETLPKEIPQL